MNFKIEIVPPSPVFQPYIEYYKDIVTDAHGRFKCVPNTNEEIYFNFKKMTLQSGNRYLLANPDVYFGGLHEYEQNAFSTLGNDVSGGFVIVFKPNGIQKLFRLSNSEIFGYVIDGKNIFRDYSEKLWHELRDTSNIHQKKAKVETFLLRFIKSGFYYSSLIDHITDFIKSEKGMLTAGQISRAYNISSRSLQRKFRDRIGMSPKEYLQITRLNYALQLIRKQDGNSLTRISYLSGYYDQAHFIKDIKKICGFPPGTFKKETDHIENCDNRNFLKLS